MRSSIHFGVFPRPVHVSPFGPTYFGAKVAGFFAGVVAGFDGVISLMLDLYIMWARSYSRLAVDALF